MATSEKKVATVTTTYVEREEEQLESTQSLPAPTSTQPLVERYWLWEFFAWIVCAAALLGMVAFLAPLNQKPVPKWVLSGTVKGYSLGFSVSINSVLSIFSATVSSAVMIPVAASIGQLKWMWFSEGQKLSDFTHFEGANSGPLGAVTLLWAMRGRRLVCLGALITIAALALDFSFQQLVTYPPAPKQVSKAWMPATATYSSYALSAPSGIAQFEYKIPDRSMSTALKIGLNGIEATVNVEPDCATGNCTWPNAIATLGVCSECFDATSTLNKSCTTIDNSSASSENCTWSYPNGLSLTNQIDQFGYITVFATGGETDNTTFFQNIKSPIAILSTIGNSHDTSATIDVFGSQCALFWCVQKYQTIINKTVVTERLVDTYRDDSATHDPDTDDLTIIAPGEFMHGTDYQDGSSSAFTVSANASRAFLIFFYTKSNLIGSIIKTPTQHFTTPTDMMSYLWPLDNAGMTQAMNWLAGNMTNVIRMASRVPSADNSLGVGITWQDVPKVNVVWPWIAIPAGLIVLSLLFMILTMIATARRNAMLWKSSSLAPFYHPLADDGRRVLSRASGPKELVRIAQGLKVKSERTEKGPRLVRIE